jgi:hypothetical protein
MMQGQQTPTWPPAKKGLEEFEFFEVKKEPSTKRTKALKEIFLDAHVMIDPEFSVLFTKGWKTADGQPHLIRRARAIRYALEDITPVINEHELLVMQKNRYLRGAIPYTSCCEFQS